MNCSMAKRVYLYGLDNEYHVVHYIYINDGDLTVREMKLIAKGLRSNFPSVKYVYAVDNSYSIYAGCRDSMKTNSVENRVLFKVTLEKEGIML